MPAIYARRARYRVRMAKLAGVTPERSRLAMPDGRKYHPDL